MSVHGRSAVVPPRPFVLFVVALLTVAAGAAAQPTMNVGPNMGTFSLGQLEWWLVANGGAGGACAWTVLEGPAALPPGLALRTDIPPRAVPGASAGIMGVATQAGYYPFTVRLTCDGQGTADQPTAITITNLRITSPYQMPDGLTGEPYSYGFSAAGGAGPVTWTSDNALPDGLELGSDDGVLSGTPLVAGNFMLNLVASDGTSTIRRPVWLTLYGAVHITSTYLPNATRGVPYTALVEAAGGATPYTFSVNGGGLPPGLTMNASGAITGTPLNTGRYQLWVNVTDANGAGHGRNIVVFVGDETPALLQVAPHGGMFDDCTVGVPCSLGLFLPQGGAAPFTWAASNLPPGFSIRWDPAVTSPYVSPGDAEIVGVGAAAGTYLVRITATDSRGWTGTVDVPLTVSPLMLSPDDSSGTVGVPYSATMRVLGGAGPYTGAITYYDLPAGLSFDPNTLVVSGVPLESGGFHIDFRFQDGNGVTLDASQHIQIAGTSPSNVNNAPALGTITLGNGYQNQLSACCAAAYEWALVSGLLPDGLSLSPSGLLGGTPTVAGTFTFTVRATEVGNPANTALRHFTVEVSPINLAMNPSFPAIHTGESFETTLAVTGNTGTVTWAVARFSFLPPGLTLSPGGVLSGTPDGAGQHNFNLTATDEAGHTFTSWFNLPVYPAGVNPPVQITTAADLGTWSVGEIQASIGMSGGVGNPVWSLVSGQLPKGVSLRWGADLPAWMTPGSAGLFGIATETGVSTFTLRVTSGADQFERTFTARVTSLRSLSSSNLPDAIWGEPYSTTLQAAGTSGTPAWSSHPGMPAWLALSADGTLSGTPPSPGGWFGFSATLTADGTTVYPWFNLAAYRVRFTTTYLPNAAEGVPYSAALEYTPASRTPQLAIVAGSLPQGLTMTPDGQISGTPGGGTGRYPFLVRDSAQPGMAQERWFAIYLTGDQPSLPMIHAHGYGVDDCTIYVPCSRQFWLSGTGAAPFTWTATGLPQGLVMRTVIDRGTPGDGEIVGTPSEAGEFPVTVTVTDGTGASSTVSIVLHVSPMALRIDSTNATVNQPFSTTLRVLGGTGPYTGSIVAGELVAGLTFDGATGVISGTPRESSGTHVVFRFTDTLGESVTMGFGTAIQGVPANMWVNTPGNLGYASQGSPYTFQFSACCAPSLAWNLVDGALPDGLSLSGSGLLSGAVTAAGTYSFLLSATDTTDSQRVVYRQFTLTVTPLVLSVIGDGSWGNVGDPYSVGLSATGATGAVTWSLAPFNLLPPGVSIDPAGSVTGTPTSTGAYQFAIIATDAAGHTAQLSLFPSIYPAGVSRPVVMTQYPGTITRSIGEIEEPLTASGGDGTYTWSIVAGALPPGVSLRHRPDLAPWWSPQTSAGLIGIATQPGTFTFTLRVSSGTSHVDRSCRIVVLPLRAADSHWLPPAFVGRPYSATLTAAGQDGIPSFALNNPGAPLPPGLELDAAGLVSGVPTQAGNYSFDLSITDNQGKVGQRYSINVYAVAITNADGRLPNAVQYEPYAAQIEASGGTGPYTYGQGGGLPGGLVLNTVTGEITGTATFGTGNFGFWVTVTDANHVSHTRMLALNVVGAPKRLPAISVYGNGWDDCTVGVPCTQGVSVASGGGTAPFVWEAEGLPPGMNIRTAGASSNSWMTPGDGEIWGSPGEAGTFDVRVTVTDADGRQATNTFPLTVSNLMARDFDGNGTRGEAFEAYPFPMHYRRVRVIGGEYAGYPAYTSAIVSGRLPAGVVMDAATQTLSGTPVEDGGFGFTLLVTDTASPANQLRTSFGFNIGGGTSTVSVNEYDLGYATIGQAYSRTLSACCSPSGYVWSTEPAGTPLPAGLTLSAAGLLSGTVSGTPGPVTFVVRATDAGNPNNFSIRVLTLTLRPAGPSIATNWSLPYGVVGVPYSQTLTATGGVAPITWTLAPGAYLPPGFTLSTDGVLGGTPLFQGQYRFGVLATGANGGVGSLTFSLEIYPPGQAPPIGWSLNRTRTTTRGVYSVQLSPSDVVGGAPPYTFSLTPDGELPVGAAQVPGMRVQQGRPFPTNFGSSAVAGYMGVIAEPGVYHPSLRVTDAIGQQADLVLSLTVPALAIVSGSLPNATAGVPYSFAVVPYDGTGRPASAYLWSATGLPGGLSVGATTGVISGTPAAAGPSSPVITVMDASTGESASLGFSITVNSFAIETSGMLPAATVNVPYSVTLTAPGCANCTWYLRPGSNLPGGLSLSSAGQISGTPTSSPWQGSFQIVASGTNGGVQKAFSLTVTNPAYSVPYITSSATINDVTVGQNTGWGLWVFGGTPPYTWSLEPGDDELPPGVSLVNDGENYSSSYAAGVGQFVGRAMVAGDYAFTIRVTDAAGRSATKACTWRVSRLSFQYGNLPLGGTTLRYGIPYSQALLVLGGTGQYPEWTALSALPPGLSLDGTTGVVAGTPSSMASYTVPISAADSGTDAITAFVNINVAGPTATSPTFNVGPSLGQVSLGQQASFNVTPSGGSWMVQPTFVTALTALPPGLSIVSAGSTPIIGAPSTGTYLMGVPTAPGSYTFTLEARDSAVPPNIGARTFTLSVLPYMMFGTSTLPDASVGTPYAQPLIAFDNVAVATWAVAPGAALPPGLSVVGGNTLSGTPTQVGTFTFALTLTDPSGLVVNRTMTLKVSPLRILGPDVLPTVVVGQTYSYTFGIEGGSGEVVWSATGVPNGLTLSAGGVLSGIRTSAGNSGLVVTATSGGAAVLRRFLLPTVLPNPSVLTVPLSNTRLSDITVGQNNQVALNASGGLPPYTWSVAAGSALPPGLALLGGASLVGSTPGSWALAGLPSVAGSYAFDLIVSDSAGTQARRTYTLNVTPLSVIGVTSTGGTTLTHTTGVAGTGRFVVSGGTAPYTFSIAPLDGTRDMLPAGITIAPDGVMSGSTAYSGEYGFLLTATDAAGKTVTRPIYLNVSAPSGLRITSVNPSDLWLGTRPVQALAVTGGPVGATYTWTLVSGAMPAGIALVRDAVSPFTTRLVGTPTEAGSFTFTLRAAVDGNPSVWAEHVFRWRVGTAQIVSPPWSIVNILDIPGATAGAPYSFTFKAAGGTPPYTFAADPFSPLPPGLSLGADGTLSGVPVSMGNYAINVVVTDASGYVSGVGGMTLIVAAAGTAAPLVRTGSLAVPPMLGSPYAYGLDILLRGGTPPFAWAVEPGYSLPPGLSVVPGANGVPAFLSGIPTMPGSYAFRMTITDSGGQTLTTAMSVGVAALTMTPDTLPVAKVGAPYSQTLVPSGGLAPYVIRLGTYSELPPGLSLSAGGLLSGTPTNAGIYSMVVQVTDAAGSTLSKTLPVFVDNALGQVPTVRLAPRLVQIYHEVGAPAPAPVPITVSSSSGALEARLSLAGAWDASLSVTSGTTPFTSLLTVDVAGLSPGTYFGLIGLASADAANQTDATPVLITVAPPPPCTYVVNPHAGSVPNTGGAGTFTVSTGWTCGWTAESSAPWLRITSGPAGTGSGSVVYDADPNPDPDARTATIIVNGAVHTVTQFGTACSFAISPSTLTATAAGGTASIQVTASSGACGWTAVSSSTPAMSFVPASGTGSGTILVTVPANASPGSRVLTATIAGLPLTVSQSGVSCTVSLSPYHASVPAGSSAGSVEVITPAGCTYDTVLGPSWISVTSGGTGTGTGTLVYTVEANSTTYPRTGALVIGGQAFTIEQDPLPCSVTLDTTGLGSPYGAGAAAGTIALTANGPNCSWTASSSVPWAVVVPASGTGNRTLSVSIASNAASTVPRTGDLLIAGQSVALSQAGTTCTFALDSVSGVAPPSGGSTSVRVIAPAACTWTASSQVSWLTITSSGSAGTSAVQFTAAPNTSALPRTGTLTLAGVTYTVDQAGVPCSYTVTGSGTSPTLPADGAAGQTFGFTGSAAGCTPSAVSYANWISVTGTTYAGTAGGVTYAVASNPFGVARSGTIQVGNVLFEVHQSGAACAYSLNAYGKTFRVAGGADTLLASPNAVGCTPDFGTDMPSLVTLGTLAGPDLNLFSLPYEVAPFTTSLTAVIRIGRITLGGQVLTIKQLSW